MRWSVLPAILIAGACVSTTAADLAQRDVEATFTSSKSPQEFAACVADNIAATESRGEGDHLWVLINDGYGVPIARWDFTRTANGSKAEARATPLATRSDAKVQSCA